MTDLSNRPAIRTGAYSYTHQMEVGNPDSVIRTQVGFYSSDDNRERVGGIYTVQFSVVPYRNNDSVPPIRNFINAVAEVLFSCEGNTVRRRCSVVNGTSISGICDHVEIRVTDASDPVDEGQLFYDLIISIAPLTRAARPEVPPVLRGVQGLSVAIGASSAVQQIPTEAGVTSVAVYGGGPGTVPVVTLQDQDGGTQASYVPDGTFKPLLPETTSIVLSNDATATAPVVFAVLWGIDG